MFFFLLAKRRLVQREGRVTRKVLQEVCFRQNAGPAATDDNWGPREVKLILDMTREKVEAATVVSERGSGREEGEWPVRVGRDAGSRREGIRVCFFVVVENLC